MEETGTRRLRQWCFVAVGLTLLGMLANAFLGNLNQDEGWYLYAARCVMEGQLPHRDFFFTQGFGFPMVYAALGWLWSPWGIFGGRLLTAGLTLGALGIASRLLYRQTQQWSAVLVLWSLLGLNLWYSYFSTIPKAYALCTLGIAGVLWLLSQPKMWAYCLTGLLCALLANVRLSMGILLPVIGLWLLLVQRNKAWLWFGIGGMVGLAGTFGVEFLFWREGFLEAQTFHAARDAMGIVGVCGCLSRIARFNPLLTFLLLFIVLTRPMLRDKPHVQLWLLIAAALGGVHLIAPVPYDDYLVPALLPLAMAVATLVHVTWAKAIFAGALVVTVLGSPVVQDWFVVRQDRFWPVFKETTDLVTLRTAAHVVRETAEQLNTDTLWTQDTYLAVEAGLRVPKGLEMGPFSKPSKPNPREVSLVALSGYTFAMNFPMLTQNNAQMEALQEVSQQYPIEVAAFPNFGQGHTGLVILRRSSE